MRSMEQLDSLALTFVAEPPARGAGLNQVIGLSIAAMVITLVLLWAGHALSKPSLELAGPVRRLAGRQVQPAVLGGSARSWCSPRRSSARCSGSSGMSAGTSAMAAIPARWPIPRTTSSSSACSGCSWRACWRSCCPTTNPARRRCASPRNWHAPVGGVLMAGCGLYAMIGFPLDDIWHRIFGQDVTLWGPTHLMMIGGAGLSLFAVLMLEYEGGRALPDAPAERPFVRFLRYLSCGGLLIGLSVYQIEYDFGVEQFRLVLQPMMIAAVASLGLVVARMTLGPGRGHIGGVVCAGTARRRGPVGGADSGRPDELVPALPRPRGGRRTPRTDSTVQAPHGFRRGRRAGCGHRRAVAGVAVDRRGLPLPVADEHVGRRPGDGRPGGGADGALRGADGNGAHRTTPPGPAESASRWSRRRWW